MQADAGRSPTAGGGDSGPCDHERILPLFDNGDHLHADDTGTQAVAVAVEIDSLSCDRAPAERDEGPDLVGTGSGAAQREPSTGSSRRSA